MKKKVYSETHKKLIDLVTWLPFGCYSDFFYDFMICFLRKGTRSMIFNEYPAKMKKQILRDLEDLERKEAEKKKKETEVKSELSEKDKLLCSSVNMLCEIKSEEVQEYLNTVIKNAFEEVRNGK